MKRILFLLLLLLPGIALADEFVQVGATSVCFGVRVSDSSSTVGAGLSGLAFNTASLVCSYYRPGVVGSTRTAITLATSTLGTYTSGAFKEIDATNLKGSYEFCPPDAAFATATNLREVLFECYGATNMAPMSVRAILTAATPSVSVTQWNGTNVASPDTAGYPVVTIKNGTGSGEIATSGGAVTTVTNVTNSVTGHKGMR